MRMQDNALAVKGLTKRYGRFALENVSFSVPRGTVVGLVGVGTLVHSCVDFAIALFIWKPVKKAFLRE